MSLRDTLRQGALTFHAVSAVDDRVSLTVSVAEGPSDPSTAAARAYGMIGDYLAGEGMAVVHERVFGSLSAHSPLIAARAQALEARGIPSDTALSYVQGRPVWGEGLAGVMVHAVRAADTEVWAVEDEGIPCGRGWMRSGGRCVILQGVHGEGGSREAQSAAMFDNAARMLEAQGLSYRDVVRTWIYIDDILEWYDDFNPVRTEAYQRIGLLPADEDEMPGGRLLLPASTGIEGANPHGAACSMDVLAIVPSPEGYPEIRQMRNVKQIDAFRYGSAFSRGACIAEPTVTHIQISGTAAVDESGNSLYPGDIRAQAAHTFDSVEALIGQEGATLLDISQATMFIKRPEDFAAVREVASKHGLGDLPAVYVHADVCRDAWLFEIDGLASFRP